MAYEIRLLDSAAAEVKTLRVFDQRRIAEEIEAQLRHEPTVAARNRKCLHDFSPSFDHEPPVWELRVGEYRVFYDVDVENQLVYVRAVRRKAQGQTTEEIT
jgi:mRNA-degrading endonuclease RelE of RelBE toxin-antitoxin system